MISKTYIDNLIIHSSTDIDLYQYRGFETYTPEIPATPTPPADDIIIWWTGEQTDGGLPRYDYYNEKDYGIDTFIAPPYKDPNAPAVFPKDSGSSSVILNPNANGSFELAPDVTYGVGNTIALRPLTSVTIPISTLRIGFWIQVASGLLDYDKGHQVSIILHQYGYEYLYININKLASYDYFIAGIHYQKEMDTPNDAPFGPIPLLTADTPYWVEFSLNGSSLPITYNMWINNVPVPLLSIQGWNSVLTDVTTSSINISFSVNPSPSASDKAHIQNLIISTDDTINFYEKGYHLLTEYPK